MHQKLLISVFAAGALLLVAAILAAPPVTFGSAGLRASPTLTRGDALATRQADDRHTAANPDSAPVTGLCTVYPQYCVPLVGGGDEDSLLADSETAAVRELETDSQAADGVVRGILPDGSFFLGDPAAPIRFRVFHNFTCGHCREYHRHDLAWFVADYVLTGQAVLEVNLLAFGSSFSDNAAFAALCAGEQGAFWEMEHELFAVGTKLPPHEAFEIAYMREIAETMDLDGAALEACILSARYRDLLDQYDTHALDAGVTGTPTVVVFDPATGEWTFVNRSYDTLADLTTTAHQ